MNQDLTLSYAMANSCSMIMGSTVAANQETMETSPSYYLLIGNRAYGWEICSPLFVKVERVNDGFIVSESRFNVYGIAATLAESIDEFMSMLVDLFEELINILCHRDSPNPFLSIPHRDFSLGID